MVLVPGDRIKETSTTEGTTDFALLGAVSEFQAFSVVGNGNTTWYTAHLATQWEVGLGTFTSPSTLERTTVYASSTGSKISFAAGTKTIWGDVPAKIIGYLVNLPTVDTGVLVSAAGKIAGYAGFTFIVATNIATITGGVVIGAAYAGWDYPFVVSHADGGIILNRIHASLEPFIRLSNTTASSGGQLRGLAAGGLRFTDDAGSVEFARMTGTLFTVGAGLEIKTQGYFDAEVTDDITTGAVTCDFTTGNKHKIVMDEAATITLVATSGPANCQLKLSYTGSYEPTFGTAVKWPANAAPAWTKVNGKTDLIGLYWDGAAWWGAFQPNYTT